MNNPKLLPEYDGHSHQKQYPGHQNHKISTPAYCWVYLGFIYSIATDPVKTLYSSSRFEPILSWPTKNARGLSKGVFCKSLK